MDEVWPRIRVIFARRSPVAAVFRRGPSRWTLTLRWDTRTDELTAGDWLYGRLYDDRSDLSPDGRHLVYFAANFSPRPQPWATGSEHFRAGGDPNARPTWTAVSELPGLTPIGLWTKGDCWGGGGSFVDDDTVALSDPIGLTREELAPRAVRLAPDQVTPAERLARQGWTQGRDADVMVKARPNGTAGVPQPWLEASPTWATNAMPRALVEPDGTRHPLGDVDGVDFDQTGRLIAVHEGRLVRVELRRGELTTATIADLNPYHR